MLDEASFSAFEAVFDRDSSARETAELLEILLQDDSVRYAVAHDSKVLARAIPAHDGAPLMALLPAAALPTAGAVAYLGRLAVDHPDAPAGTRIVLMRPEYEEVGTQADPLAVGDLGWLNPRRSAAALHDLDTALWLQSLALLNWHDGHGFCSFCGAKTVVEQAGWSRRCLGCSRQVFPRTDPAVIVAVTDSAERILLGSQTSWEPNRWSILAGFVEAGEDLESAARREVFEESGVRLSELSFVRSQPWPFPQSLMFGFEAKAVEGDALRPDGTEISALRWFSRAELLEERANLLLPGHASIARKLIERWLGQPLDANMEASA